MKKIKTRKVYFIIIMICSILTIMSYYFVNMSGKLSFIFIDENAPGLDFFQCMAICRNGSQWDGEVRFPYPPLMAFYYKFMSFTCNLITPVIRKLSFKDAFDAYAHINGTARGINFYFSIMIVVLYIIIIIEYIQRNKYKISTLGKYLLSIIVLTSDGIFHVLKTSNSLRMAIFCTMFFVLYHNDKNIKLKNISIILLSLGINIKPYIAIFLLILIVEKKYKELLWSLILSFVLFMIPLFALNGGIIDNVIKFIIQLFSFKTSSPVYSIGIRGIAYSINYCLKKLFDVEINISLFLYILFVLLIVGLIVTLFYVEKNWKKYMIISILLLMIPLNYKYVLGFLSINVLLFLLEEENVTKNNILYLLFLLLPMVPCHFPIKELYALQIQCANISLIFLGIIILKDEWLNVKKYLIKRSY